MVKLSSWERILLTLGLTVLAEIPEMFTNIPPVVTDAIAAVSAFIQSLLNGTAPAEVAHK